MSILFIVFRGISCLFTELFEPFVEFTWSFYAYLSDELLAICEMAVDALHVSLICTVLSFVGLNWWSFDVFGKIKADNLFDRSKDDDTGRISELLLGSRVAVTLLLNFAVNVFVLVILFLKARVL